MATQIPPPPARSPPPRSSVSSHPVNGKEENTANSLVMPPKPKPKPKPKTKPDQPSETGASQSIENSGETVSGTEPKTSTTAVTLKPRVKPRKSSHSESDNKISPTTFVISKESDDGKLVKAISNHASAHVHRENLQPQRPSRPSRTSNITENSSSKNEPIPETVPSEEHQHHPTRPQPPLPSSRNASTNEGRIGSKDHNNLVAEHRPARPPKPTVPPSSSLSSLSCEANFSQKSSEQPPRPAKPTRPTPPSVSSSKPPSLPPRPKQGHPLYHYMVTGPRIIALFDWAGENEGDLSIKQGDILRLLEWKSPDWILADSDGKQGILPVVFVDVEEDLPISGSRVVAVFDFEGQLDHELSFGAGDELELLGVINEEWYRGRLHGKIGAFPISFVEVVEPLANANHEDWPKEWKAAIEAADAEAEAVTVEDSCLMDDMYTPNEDLEDTFCTYDKPDDHVDDEPDNQQCRSDTVDNLFLNESMQNDLPLASALYDYEGQDENDLSFQAGDKIELVNSVNEDWLVGRIKNRTGMFPISFVDILVPLPESQGSNEPSCYLKTARVLHKWEGEDSDDLKLMEDDTITILEEVSQDWYRGRNSRGEEGLFPISFVDLVDSP